MITLYGLELSGHTHRVGALLSILGLEYVFEATAPHTPELMAMNPLGQVPVLRDGDLVLCDSNAIMVYLVKGRHMAQDRAGCLRMRSGPRMCNAGSRSPQANCGRDRRPHG